MHKNTEPSIRNLPSSASTKTTHDQLHQLLCFSRTLAAQTIILTMSDITVAPKKPQILQLFRSYMMLNTVQVIL